MNYFNTKSINECFDHLLLLISSDRFLQMQGLGNEVPFFICPFPPEESIAINRVIHQLKNRLSQKGVTVLEINLYDLAIELMKKRGIWDQVLEIEAATPKDELKELLQGVLDSKDHLIPAISEKMKHDSFDVMFITGVGEVYPFIRSHNVLNNLQSTAKDQPTIMF